MQDSKGENVVITSAIPCYKISTVSLHGEKLLRIKGDGYTLGSDSPCDEIASVATIG